MSPLFEYRCENPECAKIEEFIESHNANPVRRCSACHDLAKRIQSVPAIAFEGGGWFRDGYQKKS